MTRQWQGVYPAVTTQFNDDESINFESTQRMLDTLIKEGVHGIVACGTVGENYSLSKSEKLDVIRAAKEVIDGRVPLVSGVAETTTQFTIDYCKEMEKIGIDSVMVLPTTIYHPDEREGVYHYQQVARSTDLPIMIYNNPVTYAVDISIEGMKVLAKEDNIVSIKESTADTRRITELFNTFGDRFDIFGGVDDIALETLMLGATGWISGLTNVFPKESVAIYELAQQGRFDEAREIWRWFLPLLRLDTIPTLVQCIKYAEQLAGRGSENLRAPRLPLPPEQKKYVKDLYDKAMESRIDLSKYNLD
jgi:4-hydroxy-tetrahydrodipicolinate synthase